MKLRYTRTAPIAVMALIGLGLLSNACKGRDPGRDEPATTPSFLSARAKAVEIDLTRAVPEETAGTGLFDLPSTHSYPALIGELTELGKSQSVRGVLVRLGGNQFDWARSEELGRELARLKASGKKVICHSHAYSNSLLLLAARACDRIWLSPAGDVEAVGLAGQVVYLKDLLDRFKVQADFLHVGKYKSAAESLTNSGPSDEARNALKSVLGSIRQTWLEGVTQARSGPEVKASLEQGPWDAKEALRVGLIDAIGYESEAEAELKKLAESESVEKAFGLVRRRDAAKEIAELVRVLAGARAAEGRDDRIALVVATGSIGMEPGGMFSSGGIAHRPLAKTIRRLSKDDSVKAVVLRISSPGGSALASDLLWHELKQLRDKKPLIVSVGEMAASGGYYMACAGHQIVAERSSIVGSIGVVGGKLVFGEALGQFGVRGVTFAASDEPGAEARAAYMSALTPWDDATRERIQAQMNSIYDLFVARVAEGRQMSREAVHEIAQGRIWTGEQGIANKLVDRLGGLSDSIALARSEAKLGDDIPLEIEGAGETWLDFLGLDERAEDVDIRSAIAQWRSQPPALAEQLSAELRPFAAMLEPLLAGETALTILPYAFTSN